MAYTLQPRPHLSLGALLAILAALGSLVATLLGHPGWGTGLGAVSLPLGLIGLISSISPAVRGGWASIAAVTLGVVGLVLGILDLVFNLVTWPVP